MNQSQLSALLSQTEKKAVYFGPQGFIIAGTEGDLTTYQQGFAIRPDGTNLSGNKPGDWQSSWCVIAMDTELGDPYFVDTNEEQLPVYTAVQADGLWQPELVSSSLEGFLECLTLLINHGNQEIAQFVPDETTILDTVQLEQLKAGLIKASGCADFWTFFFECYFDWLQDDD